MLDLQQRIEQRFPQWFSGPRALLARPLLRSFAKLSRLQEVEAFLAASGHLQGLAFVDAAVEHLQLRYSIDQVERERVPTSGRLLIVANHPCGALDALALLHFVGSRRRDVRILGNDFLAALTGLGDLLLPLRILGGRPGAESIAAVDAALAAEQCVIVFPAGEVSRLGLTGIRDPRWRRGFLRFARKAAAPVLPVRIRARNSALFYGASVLCKPAGTLLLPRELLARRRPRLELRVGLPMPIAADITPARAMTVVRQALEAIGTRREAQPAGPAPVIAPVDRRLLLQEIRQLQPLGQTPDGKRILLGRLRSDSLLLRELGRLRELSFRAVGEGTGRALDIDAFDTWYEHIVLWDAEAVEVAGAYRVARGEEVLAERGMDGFYSAGLFRYGCEMLPRLAQGLELGRSFVAPPYWNSRSLDYLWLGIGAYLRRHPGVRYLFGPVSISGALPLPAREQLVAYYARYFGQLDGRVGATVPFRFAAQPPDFGELDAEQSFRLLKANLAALGARVPTLYKQYTELCEPGGARFLAFGVDPDFNNAIDGLIEVDLQRVRDKRRERYLGGGEARAA